MFPLQLAVGALLLEFETSVVSLPLLVGRMDPLWQVDAWWAVLLPRMLPLLWENGGPVIMVQVSNKMELGTEGMTQGESEEGEE